MGSYDDFLRRFSEMDQKSEFAATLAKACSKVLITGRM